MRAWWYTRSVRAPLCVTYCIQMSFHSTKTKLGNHSCNPSYFKVPVLPVHALSTTSFPSTNAISSELQNVKKLAATLCSNLRPVQVTIHIFKDLQLYQCSYRIANSRKRSSSRHRSYIQACRALQYKSCRWLTVLHNDMQKAHPKEPRSLTCAVNRSPVFLCTAPRWTLLVSALASTSARVCQLTRLPHAIHCSSWRPAPVHVDAASLLRLHILKQQAIRVNKKSTNIFLF